MRNELSISIVIPTYNRAHLLGELLESLEKLLIPDHERWEVLVVDNNSSDNTKDVVGRCEKRKILPIRYLCESNQGASHARNRGIREANGEIIAFLDDDETVDTHWLLSLRETFDRFACMGVGGKVVAKWTFPCPEWYTRDGPYRIVGPTSGHNMGEVHKEYSVDTLMPVGANFAVKRECFERYGYFRTDMGPLGNSHGYSMGEDTEFCMRILQAGQKIIYSPEAITYNVVHPDRVTKKYCRRFHFRYGRMQSQIYPPKQGTRMYGNVPRYLFRQYAQTILFWIQATVSGNKGAAFYYYLALSRITGHISGHLGSRCHNSHMGTGS